MLRLLSVLIFMVFPAFSAVADPIEGRWNSKAAGPPGIVQVSPCRGYRGYFCALPVAQGANQPNTSSVIKPAILAAFRKAGEGKYTAHVLGISGLYYASSAELVRDVLKVRRCERWGVLTKCWTDSLTRVK